jgi:hypothetical protein
MPQDQELLKNSLKHEFEVMKYFEANANAEILSKLLKLNDRPRSERIQLLLCSEPELKVIKMPGYGHPTSPTLKRLREDDDSTVDYIKNNFPIEILDESRFAAKTIKVDNAPLMPTTKKRGRCKRQPPETIEKKVKIQKEKPEASVKTPAEQSHEKIPATRKRRVSAPQTTKKVTFPVEKASKASSPPKATRSRKQSNQIYNIVRSERVGSSRSPKKKKIRRCNELMHLEVKSTK